MSAEIEKFGQVERIRGTYTNGFTVSAVDGKHYDDLLSLARKQAEELAKMPKWVAVEQELPPLNCMVLGFADGEQVTVERRSNPMHKSNWWESIDGNCEYKITHWAPLLTPPSTEETNEGI